MTSGVTEVFGFYVLMTRLAGEVTALVVFGFHLTSFHVFVTGGTFENQFTGHGTISGASFVSLVTFERSA